MALTKVVDMNDIFILAKIVVIFSVQASATPLRLPALPVR
jgi:hypothetical protein